MNKYYFDRLPDDLRTMVVSIEIETSLEIEVEVDQSRAGKFLHEPDTLACVVNEFEARLLIPSPNTFPSDAVLHELLHIQRFLVEGVPQIAVCENRWHPELEKIFTDLDNNLEHLVIVPKELAQRPKRKDRWISILMRVLAKLQSVGIEVADRNFLAIYGHFFVGHVLGDEDLQKKYTIALDNYNLLESATEFSLATASALSSKEATTRAWVEQLHISSEFLCLDYFDPRKGTYQQQQLS